MEGDTLKTKMPVKRTVTAKHKVMRSTNGRRNDAVNTKDTKHKGTDYAIWWI